MKQGRRALQFIFASLMDICHLKNAELEAKHQKYKGRVVLRGDTVKDDSGSYAAFAEQGSSASQMTAAKIMDIISRLPGCDGQAADAVSAYTQEKIEECSQNVWKSPNHNVQTLGFVYHNTNGLNHGPVWKIQSFLLSGICTVILWKDYYGKRQFEKILLKHGWEKIPNWECLFVHREKGLFLSVCVDDIKLAGKKQNIDPMWKVLNKEVDLGEPTSFFDQVYLGCTQRQCEVSQDIVDNYRTMFESRISAERTEKLPFTQNLRISSWFVWHGGSCKEVCGTILWVGNQDDSTTLHSIYSMHRWPPLQRRRNKICWRVVKYMLSNCSEMLVLGTYWKTWIFYGQWTKLHDRLQNGPKLVANAWNRLISYIRHTCEYKQYCNVGNTAKHCRLGLFQDSDFAGDREDSKSTSGGTLCIFGSHTLVPISWMCKKQTSVSHSSTESEIISLDTGLRLDGLLALEFCGIWLFESLETRLNSEPW